VGKALAASTKTPHNNRMHQTGRSGLRPLSPAGDAKRYTYFCYLQLNTSIIFIKNCCDIIFQKGKSI
jgi:hypothetical protein